jgi:hypothetical protein
MTRNDHIVNHFLMETTISSEEDFKEYPDKLPDNLVMIHFKMIGIGPQTMAKAEHSGSEICKIVREQPGFFLVSQDGSGLRDAMHDLVDRFCNAQDGTNQK